MESTLLIQYSSVYSKPKEMLPSSIELFPVEKADLSGSGNKLLDIIFGENDIIEAIDDISPTAAAGPDGFPAILLKQCKEALSKPLFLLWRKFLDLGMTPESLKMGHIIPTHKGGSNGVASHYRPVALTSHIIKIFEKIVRKNIVDFMERHDLFNNNQHGFRMGRSCLSQLLSHYDKILSLLEQGLNVDVIYLDFSKAFDKLDFHIILKKLKELGITGKLGRWIHSFLTGRNQSVLVNGTRSAPTPVLSGVPQGSVIGPLLFLVLIGDIDEFVNYSFLSSFADDTRVAKGIRNIQEASQLQLDLNEVYAWAESNNMTFLMMLNLNFLDMGKIVHFKNVLPIYQILGTLLRLFE